LGGAHGAACKFGLLASEIGDRLSPQSARCRSGAGLLRRSHPGKQGWSREVALFVDTFNRWFEPHNVRAAIRVLQAAGYRVHAAQPLTIGRPLCCGRTFLSAGLVEQAKAEARRTLQALKPWVDRGAAVIGLEPSCLLTFRDEFCALLPGSDVLARHSFLFEEFIARELDAGRFSASFTPLAKTALLHGHCHQKAFDAMPAVTRC